GATIQISAVLQFSIFGILIPAFLLSLIFPEILNFYDRTLTDSQKKSRWVAYSLASNAFAGALAILVTVYFLMPKVGTINILILNLGLFIFLVAFILRARKSRTNKLLFT